jgi:hypothetical protein
MRKIDCSGVYLNPISFAPALTVTITFEDDHQTKHIWHFEPATGNVASEEAEKEFLAKSLGLSLPITDEEWFYFKNQVK